MQIDPYSYPNVIGDAASEWKISPDGLTYSFKIRQGIKFHDGSTMTAADVKATYDKIDVAKGGLVERCGLSGIGGLTGVAS